MDAPQRFQKQPVVVEAIQWTGENNPAVMEFCGTKCDDEGNEYLRFVPLAYPEPKLWVDANACWVPVSPGEWIIRDRLGFYPCNPSVFAETYQPAA